MAGEPRAVADEALFSEKETQIAQLQAAIAAFDQPNLTAEEVISTINAMTDCFIALIGEEPTRESITVARNLFLDFATNKDNFNADMAYRWVLESALVKIANRPKAEKQTSETDDVTGRLNARALAAAACQIPADHDDQTLYLLQKVLSSKDGIF